jgi:hypothetical protein
VQVVQPSELTGTHGDQIGRIIAIGRLSTSGSGLKIAQKFLATFFHGMYVLILTKNGLG